MSNRKEIKYIGFYDLPNSKSGRVCNLAATNKMDYICSAINRAGYDVNIISPSWIGDSSGLRPEKESVKKINDYTKVTFFASWVTHNKVTRNIKIAFTLCCLFLYLVLHTHKDEKVLAYHVPWISWPIRAAKFIRGFYLILEIEEIYQDVMIVNSLFSRWESKLVNKADAYLLSTDLLVERLGSKPHVVIYGVYDVHESLVSPPEDGKVHLLYAGIIDRYKKGAFNALASAQYLPGNYHLHIIGFGETEQLIRSINESNKINKCQASYDGLKSGCDYIKFCQSCHIGLSTQTMGGKYLESSFPSKVLSYLSMGLRVVSCNIKCVSQSQIGSLMTYYYGDTPEAISNAVKSIDIDSDFDSRSGINELDKKFVKEIRGLISS